ncbi:MAG: TrpB-like pyridoxal phosphate-dependent enzyme [Thermoprotei archaeon]
MHCEVITILEEIIPKYWYNIAPDLPKPIPPPIDPLEINFSLIQRLEELLPHTLIDQEFTFERFIPIPEEVREAYRYSGRPTPLYRAKKLEKTLKTPARIYYKYEGVLRSGSHKLNTAIPQVFYALKEGYSEVVTETGAGQWGLAISIASKIMKLDSTIFMTKSSYLSKKKRLELMIENGAHVYPSPSNLTEIGSYILKKNSEHPGSLGLAISEAVEWALKNTEKRRYLPGSVMEYILLHQSVIGLEAIEQMRQLDEEPDIIIGCVGGGSNLAGISYPFYKQYLKKTRKRLQIVAAESSLIPKISKGIYRYEHPDFSGALPMIKMINIGRDFIPPPIKAAGLRFHGVAASLSVLINEGLVKPKSYSPEEVKKAAELFYKTEGILPAPESAHAIAATIEEALKVKQSREAKVILFNLSGHGLYDEDFYEG